MPNISGPRLAQLEQAERDLAELQKVQSIKWVGDALGQAWATCQATKPWNQWSQFEMQLLRNVCKGASTAFQVYKSLLPSASEEVENTKG